MYLYSVNSFFQDPTNEYNPKYPKIDFHEHAQTTFRMLCVRNNILNADLKHAQHSKNSLNMFVKINFWEIFGYDLIVGPSECTSLLLLGRGWFLLSKNCVNSNEDKAPCKLVAVLHGWASKTRNSSKAHRLQEAWYIDVFTKILCVNTFASFAWNWPEHANLGGKKHCYQFTHKLRKNTKNTVFSYKKGSKTKSENKKIFFDPKLYIESFCTFVKNLIVLDVFVILGFLVRICV